jgi:hypothetical protein
MKTTTIDWQCNQCGKPIKAQADLACPGDWVDRLLCAAACNSCADTYDERARLALIQQARLERARQTGSRKITRADVENGSRISAQYAEALALESDRRMKKNG